MKKLVKCALILIIMLNPIFFFIGFDIEAPQSQNTKYYKDLLQYSNLTFAERQDLYLNGTHENNGLHAQAACIYLGPPINETSIRKILEDLNNYEDTSDFDVNVYLRILYYDNITNILSSELKAELKEDG